MKDFIAWLVTSSADPRKVSLTVKGFLLGLAPLAMFLLGFTEAEAQSAADAIANLVLLALSIVSTIQIVWGLMRKATAGRWSARQD